ncbi:hypothetical protein [Methylobacterium iners]|uniref:Uncharacterized protein n=1 Tax=Methylobacterium iners TaxID=418707 RepID=A0ABQ4S4J7_9HYPH|nr:hypothetical protein [Methylobacterium iners]GJD97846.1 hypothetical protein OCOJLMKI_5085 [Methylobacterium iners]
MRHPLFTSLILLLLLGDTAAMATSGPSEATHPADLKQRWHRCVRNAFSGQPMRVDTAGAQRAALAACKAHEDAYVAAMLAAQGIERAPDRRDEEAVGSGPRAWVASVTAYLIDPIASWLAMLRR